MKRVAIIKSSDTGYRGEREDLSGPAIKEIVEREGYEVVSMDILPDDQVMLAGKMQESTGNPGGNACIQHDDHKKSNAEPCNCRNPRKDTDHQSSGKSESG